MPVSLASPGPSQCPGCATLAGMEPPPFTPNSRLGGLLAAPQDRDQPRGSSSSLVCFDFWCIPKSGRVCLGPHGTPKLPPQPVCPRPCRQPAAFWPAWEEESGLSPLHHELNVPAQGLVTVPVPRRPLGVTAGKRKVVFLPTSQAVLHPTEPKEGETPQHVVPPGAKPCGDRPPPRACGH